MSLAGSATVSPRRRRSNGESSQLLLFYNPGQKAWFGWWIGNATGLLRRQVMVAPGHFMLTRYFDQDTSLSIELPSNGTSAE